MHCHTCSEITALTVPGCRKRGKVTVVKDKVWGFGGFFSDFLGFDCCFF